ncbi:MAG: alpha-amylase family glycosyl hydrolase [Oscillospiraceae bacterium]|jgi:glycosidase
MWIDNSVFYQIYPLGFCGAPKENDNIIVPRIKKVAGWADHIKKIGADAIYFCPIFQSDRHGYDTRDYFTLDSRLGTNDDFRQVCEILHKENIKVVLDGVFNHVGRGFWAFQDVLKNREASPYKDWFRVDFGRNSNYNDGLWYEGWEGHFELVKLNLKNQEVVDHLFSAIKMWSDEFGIDGLRLDVAYCLDKEFLKKLRSFCNSLKPDFALIGEILFGDYNTIVNDEMLHSCTNYECYKGLHSSFNELNMFEISYSLNRQFGSESWTLYKGKHLLNFADNHDVPRLASILKEKRQIPVLYGMLFGIPGIPCIYYGSEWGAQGLKQNCDAELRPCFEFPIENELTALIAKLSKLHKNSRALIYGGYKSIVLTNHQHVFERSFEGEKILIAVNAGAENFTAHNISGIFQELITDENITLTNGLSMPPYSVQFLRQE